MLSLYKLITSDCGFETKRAENWPNTLMLVKEKFHWIENNQFERKASPKRKDLKNKVDDLGKWRKQTKWLSMLKTSKDLSTRL